MNEELQQRLIQSIDKVSTWVESAEGFAIEQTPLILQEMLAYGWWMNVFSVSLCIILVLPVAWVIKRIYSAVMDESKDESYDRILATAFSYFPGLLLIPIFINIHISICTLIKISLAPRIYILGQIGDLL